MSKHCFRIFIASILETAKYGWQIHPITLVIDHHEMGKIGIKTEIHSENDWLQIENFRKY